MISEYSSLLGLGEILIFQSFSLVRASSLRKKHDTRNLAKIRFITTNNDNCQYDASSSLVNMGEWVLDSSEARGVFYLHTR